MAYGVMADLHCRNWTQFVSINSYGVNSRLNHTLDEITRCAAEVRKAGGSRIYIAGDVFHDRGYVEPSVFIPLVSAMRHATALYSTDFIITPGNHDLASRNTVEFQSAVKMLDNIGGALVSTPHEPGYFCGSGDCVALMPWYEDKTEFLNEAKMLVSKIGAGRTKEFTLLCHVGIDGVLKGVPGPFSVNELASLGFGRVMSGHYHHHAAFKAPNGVEVISIGSPTHQTWSDVGTKSGFIVVHDDHSWVHHPSEAPQFMDYAPGSFLADYTGHYVRVRGLSLNNKEINDLRRDLSLAGAFGVTFAVTPKSAPTRPGATASLSSIETSVTDWVFHNTEAKLAMEVADGAQRVLREVQES